MGITTAIILLGGHVSYDEFDLMWHEDGYAVFPTGFFRPQGHCLLGPSETPKQDGYVTVEAKQWVLEHLSNPAAPQQEIDLR